jgi:hypothetical protein
MSDGGKGSAPRKQQDQGAYAKNWDTIFSKKTSENLLQQMVDENERLGLYDIQLTDNFKNPLVK